MKFAVIVFPGSNCDHDMYHALGKVCHQEVSFVWHRETSLAGFDGVMLPGGFSYGDYLRAGAIAGYSPILKEVVKMAGQGKTVLGVCNGFQVLTEAGLLPGALLRNRDLRFVCKNIFIKTENVQTRFTRSLTEGQVLEVPIAHGEGNYFIENEALKALQDNQQIAFRYCAANGSISSADNPNGSVDSIAGIINKSGNVLGMMPHPERAVEALIGSSDGMKIFESVLS